jgi:purine-binding chemotaxis protein CheW
MMFRKDLGSSLSDETSAVALIFRVRDHLCALPPSCVVETMRPLPILPMTGVPSYVRGAAIIRGAAVPVIDVAELVVADAAPAKGGAGARFITVSTAGRVVALAVDGILGLRALGAKGLAPLAPLLRDAGGSRLSSLEVLDEELLIVLREAKLVPDGLPDTGLPDTGLPDPGLPHSRVS